jgi:hypothetical protein
VHVGVLFFKGGKVEETLHQVVLLSLNAYVESEEYFKLRGKELHVFAD